MKPASWSSFSCPQLLPNVQEVLIGKRRKWVIDKNKEKSQGQKVEETYSEVYETETMENKSYLIGNDI